MSAKGLDRSLPMAAIACGASLIATWIVVTAVYDLGTTALHAGSLVVLLAVNMALAL